MRKSNWIIAAVLLLASVAFLWIWHALQFDLVDNPLDIVVTVVWWVVIAAACVAIHWAEKKRQERIRTIFVAPGLLYNSEMGVVRLSPDDEVVDALQAILSNLTYGFELAELPANSRVRFQHIVHSSKFGDAGATWEGDVVEVSRPDRPREFHDRNELASLVRGAVQQISLNDFFMAASAAFSCLSFPFQNRRMTNSYQMQCHYPINILSTCRKKRFPL